MDSIANERSVPTPTAVASRTAGRCLPMSASSRPNGAYASTLIATSERMKRGNAANRKNGVPGSGTIQPENGSRLA